MRFVDFQIALLSFLMSALSSCSDDFFDIDPTEPGAVTVKLKSSALQVASRADDEDPEFAIKGVKLYFYADSAGELPHQQAAAAVKEYKATSYVYNSRQVTVKLSDDEIAKAFPDVATKCYVYAVANLDNADVTVGEIKDNPTCDELRLTMLTNAKGLDATQTSFVMAGEGEVTLNRTTSTMQTTEAISMKRAVAKISLTVNVAQSFTSGDITYVPAITIVDGESKFLSAKINKYAYSGCVGTTCDRSHQSCETSEGHKFTKKEEVSLPSMINDEEDNDNLITVSTTYDEYQISAPFYMYATEWQSTGSDDNTTLTISVPWKTEDGSNFQYYYYQIPINGANQFVERNKHYNITVNVSMLGSKTESEQIELDDDDYLSYFVVDWNDDGTSLSAQLRQSHYLVAAENAVSLYNDNEASVEFQTCHDVTAYLTSVKYTYLKDNSEAYLLQSVYDEDTNSYTPVNSEDNDNYASKYTDSDKEHWNNSSDIKAARDYIWEHVSDFITVTEESGYNGPLKEKTDSDSSTDTDTDTSADTDTSDDTSTDTEFSLGYVNFFCDVKNVVSKLYCAVEYTIVLCSSPEHDGVRQSITITQYPSKYITYGTAGNVFVDGYYAMLNPDSGYEEKDLPAGSFLNGSWYSEGNKGNNRKWYQNNDGTSYASYSFVATTLSSDNTYYSTNSKDPYNTSIYSKSFSSETYLYEYRPVNTPYEYVQGVKQKDLVNDQTIDVHVSAFSSGEYTFAVNLSSTGTDIKTYYYRIGDPRNGTPFVCDPHTSTGTYSASATFLYDYLDHGESSNNTYYRYVTSWGEYAKQILVGAENKKYDDVIAPLFKIQSAYGALVGWAYFGVAQKRCATYQEAGYPAGRWRLPTLAEITYIVDLQRKKLIDDIFISGTTGYWTASGGKIEVPDASDSSDDYIAVYTQDYKSTSSNYAFVRCVYDLWYWGDKPQTPTHKYYPMPTKTSSSSSASIIKKKKKPKGNKT